MQTAKGPRCDLKETGWTLEYIPCAWAECLRKLEMGELDLFIVPIIHDKQDGTYYQAVFNRLKE